MMVQKNKGKCLKANQTENLINYEKAKIEERLK